MLETVYTWFYTVGETIEKISRIKLVFEVNAGIKGYLENLYDTESECIPTIELS